MPVRVDRDADAVYLNLTDAVVLESEAIADGIVVDYDVEGRIVGIEILDASKRTGDPEALKDLASSCLGRRKMRSIASPGSSHWNSSKRLVGVRGFEPPTPSSRTRCATRLRYTPTFDPTQKRPGRCGNSYRGAAPLATSNRTAQPAG